MDPSIPVWRERWAPRLVPTTTQSHTNESKCTPLLHCKLPMDRLATTGDYRLLSATSSRCPTYAGVGSCWASANSLFEAVASPPLNRPQLDVHQGWHDVYCCCRHMPQDAGTAHGKWCRSIDMPACTWPNETTLVVDLCSSNLGPIQKS